MLMRSFGSKGWIGLLGPLVFGMVGCIITEAEEDDTYSGGSGGATCSVGAPGCPCTTTGACDDGLECAASISTCVLPNTCATGAAGCECTAGGTCDAGLICKESYCVSEQPCLPEQTGTESCQCTEGGGCDPGLECLSGLCVDPAGVTTGGDGSTGGDETDTDTDGGSSGGGGSSGATATATATTG